MSTIELISEYTKLLRWKAHDFFFKKKHRSTPSDFTRLRSLSFVMVLMIMLNFKTKSNAQSVYDYLNVVEETSAVSRQAFDNAREKIRSSALKELFDDSVKMSLSVNDPKKFHNYRIVAIDGSTALLPKSWPLTFTYGFTTPVIGKTYARVSLCVDVLNEIILDGEISAFCIGERKLASKHLAKDLHSDILYLFDRGYWSAELAAAMIEKKQHFLFRLSKTANEMVTNSKSNSGNFTFSYKRKQYTVRFYKFELPSGEMEYLATNVCQEEIPDSELPKLYGLRWGVETKYDVLKNRFQIEEFSGKSVNAVEQDFYASLIVMNMTSFAILAADAKVKEAREGKANKYEYKPNGSMAVGILKNRLIKTLLLTDKTEREQAFEQLICDISKYTIPIIPDRHNPRKKTTTKHKRTRRRSSPL
jgi:hypothetical protein